MLLASCEAYYCQTLFCEENSQPLGLFSTIACRVNITSFQNPLTPNRMHWLEYLLDFFNRKLQSYFKTGYGGNLNSFVV